MRIRYLGLVPLVLLAGCGSSVDPSATLETVRANEQAQIEAIGTRDLRGAVRNYQADAVVVLPGSGTATGTAAIEQAFETLLADANLKLEATPQAGWAADSGDLAVTTSTGQLTTSGAAGETVTVPVDSQTVWRKGAGEPWQIVSEYIVARPAAAEAAPAQTR